MMNADPYGNTIRLAVWIRILFHEHRLRNRSGQASLSFLCGSERGLRYVWMAHHDSKRRSIRMIYVASVVRVQAQLLPWQAALRLLVMLMAMVHMQGYLLWI